MNKASSLKSTISLSEAEIERYSRQLILPEVGGVGQQKLKTARVLIIGLGGLGAPSALYLAAAGIGELGLIDSEPVELSNLQRQIIYTTHDVGHPKVTAVQEKLIALNPYITVKTYPERLTSQNISRLLSDYDFIVEGSDNFETKFLVNDTAVQLSKPFVLGGILQYQGQVLTVVPGAGPCYRCLFPAPPDPSQVQTCQAAGVLGSIAGVIGSLQATEVLKYFLGFGNPLSGTLLSYDATLSRFKTIAVKKNPECVVCQNQKEVFTDLKLIPLPLDVSPTHFLDLSHVVCPINYVKTKLKLEEEVKSGEILEIILDQGMPVKSVPPSVKKDGHEIIAIVPKGIQYHVFIRKKGAS